MARFRRPRPLATESRALVILLGAMTALVALAIDMSLPALPTLSREFGATPDTVQLTLSLFILGYGAGQLVYGPLSDRFGRRRMLLIGLAMYMAAGLACAVSPRIEILIAARIVMGFGGCVGPVLARAIVRDHFGGARAAQVFSSLTAVFAVGPLVAPVIGGFLLVHFGWQSIFLLLCAFGAALFAIIALRLAESLKEPDPHALRLRRLAGNYRAFLTNRVCVGYAFVNGLCWAGIFAFLSGSPFVFIEVYGVAPEHYGFYFGLSAVSLVAGAMSNKFLLRRFRAETVLKFGFAMTISGGAVGLGIALSPAAGALGFMAGLMIYIYGQAVVMPNAMAGGMEPVARMAGTAASLMGAIQMGCGAIVGYFVNALYDGTAVPMAAIILLMGVAATAVYYLMLRPKRVAG